MNHLRSLCQPEDGVSYLFIITTNRVSEKLDMLYRKSLYLVALILAATQNVEPSSVADIRRQYGDHLYSRGDYDGAMNQYVQTIGHLQPSYVIRKVIQLVPGILSF
jgi:hypothetical protein